MDKLINNAYVARWYIFWYLDEKKLEIQKEVFTTLQNFIVGHLTADDIVDDLISEHLIGDNAREQLSLTSNTPKKKNRIIMDELNKGGPDTLEKFCKILNKKSETQHIAKRLEEGSYLCTRI